MVAYIANASKYLGHIPQIAKEYTTKIRDFAKKDPKSAILYTIISAVPLGVLSFGVYTIATAKDEDSVVAGLAATVTGTIVSPIIGLYIGIREGRRKTKDAPSIESLRLEGKSLEDTVIRLVNFLSNYIPLDDGKFDEVLHIFPYLDRHPWEWKPARIAAQRANREEEFKKALKHYRQEVGYNKIKNLDDRTNIIEMERCLV